MSTRVQKRALYRSSVLALVYLGELLGSKVSLVEIRKVFVLFGAHWSDDLVNYRFIIMTWGLFSCKSAINEEILFNSKFVK